MHKTVLMSFLGTASVCCLLSGRLVTTAGASLRDTVKPPSKAPSATKAFGMIRQLPQSPAIRIQKDLEYGRVDGISLKLDLYLPAEERSGGGGTRPGILFLHGGGWTGGDKQEFAEKAREMASRGYVAASANYRLAPMHRYPAAVEDVQRAVRWLRTRAGELRLDPNRIGAMGASAGGHLASLLGLLDTLDRSVPGSETSSRVNCVVDYYGRMDLTLEVGKGGKDYRPTFIGKNHEEALPLYLEASPITHVDVRTVPFLIVQGARDPQVDPIQSQKMFAVLDKANIEASLILLAGQGHGFRGEGAVLAWEAAKGFLDRHLMK